MLWIVRCRLFINTPGPQRGGPAQAQNMAKFFLAALAVSCFHDSGSTSTDTHHPIRQTFISSTGIPHWVESKSSHVIDALFSRIDAREETHLEKKHGGGESTAFDDKLREKLCCTVSDHTYAPSWRKMQLRGGAADQVLPTAGPPAEDGKLRACAQCGALETRVTLGHCKITQLYFCARTECRRRHWKANEAFWRERAAQVYQYDLIKSLTSLMPCCFIEID